MNYFVVYNIFLQKVVAYYSTSYINDNYSSIETVASYLEQLTKNGEIILLLKDIGDIDSQEVVDKCKEVIRSLV